MLRTLIFSFALFLMFFSELNAQSIEEFFEKDTEITWIGVDFSHMKLIGEFTHFMDLGNQNSSELKEKYFPAWNDIIVYEDDKYDVKGMLRKKEVEYDLEMMYEINDSTDLSDIKARKAVELKKRDIQEIISQYQLSKSSGIGVGLVCEYFSKNYKEAYFHFVAFSMSSKNILIHERIKGEPGGFGIRNYWANSIYEVLRKVEGEYKTWKKQMR